MLLKWGSFSSGEVLLIGQCIFIGCPMLPNCLFSRLLINSGLAFKISFIFWSRPQNSLYNKPCCMLHPTSRFIMSHLAEKSYPPPPPLAIKTTGRRILTLLCQRLSLSCTCSQSFAFGNLISRDGEHTGFCWVICLERSKVLFSCLLGTGQVTTCLELSFFTPPCPRPPTPYLLPVLVKEPIKCNSIGQVFEWYLCGEGLCLVLWEMQGELGAQGSRTWL